MEGFLIDILILAVFLITVGVFTYKGFAKSVMGFAIILASFIFAKLFGGIVGGWIDSSFMFDSVKGAIHSVLVNTIGEAVGSIDGEALFEKIPEAVRNILDLAGADVESLKEAIVSMGSNAGDELAEISAKIAAPISAFISEIIGYVGLFIIGIIGFKLLSYLLIGILELPVLRTLNHFAGMLMGIVAGFLLSWGFAVLFRTVIGMLAIKYPVLVPFSNATDTFIYSFFSGLNV